MRVLKFRFYDFKIKKQMIYQNSIEAKDVIFNQWENTPKCSPIMQYTGLKDSKGVEIYEGDIVQYKQRNLGQAFGIEKGPDYLEKKSQIIYMDQGFNVPAGFIRDLEVVGNIYELEVKPK